jgi:hypothetical protein
MQTVTLSEAAVAALRFHAEGETIPARQQNQAAYARLGLRYRITVPRRYPLPEERSTRTSNGINYRTNSLHSWRTI